MESVAALLDSLNALLNGASLLLLARAVHLLGEIRKLRAGEAQDGS